MARRDPAGVKIPLVLTSDSQELRERERERARAPVLDYTEPSRAERSRPDEKSWLFEGIDTFLYDLMRKSKKKITV